MKKVEELDPEMEAEREAECRRSAINTALFFQRATKQVGYKGEARFGQYRVKIQSLGVAVFRGRDLLKFYADPA